MSQPDETPDRLRAAQAAADEVIGSLAGRSVDSPHLLRVAVTDPETNTRLATGFVAYSPEPPAGPRLRLVPEAS